MPRAFAVVSLLAGACAAQLGQNTGPMDMTPTSCDGGATVLVCAGHCVDTATDAANCGMCGHACSKGDQCCDGACVTTASCSFAPTSVDPSTGWQNGGGWATVHGHGFAPGMKVFVAGGRAPTKVLSTTDARILLPPGPVGPTDVKIVSPNIFATLRGGFVYEAGGLEPPWQQKPMKSVRGEDPGVAVLQDGRVLVAGGTTVPDQPGDTMNTAELYDRNSDMVTPAMGPMSIRRWHDCAITLLDGHVLVAGGCGGCGDDATKADLFDPTTSTFAPTTGPLNMPREECRGVLLPDGRALIASGNDPSLETFDPATGKFTLVANTVAHPAGFVVRLRDGRAMIGAGDGGIPSVQIFDPDTNMLAATGALAQGRSMLTAHVLPDGRVAVIGGASMSAGSVHVPLDSIELWDPTSGMWSTAPYKLSVGRCWHASALVRDGTILVMGGYTMDKSCMPDDTVDQIDPVAMSSKPFLKLPNPNTEWTAVTMLDGSVLGVGGGACSASMALPDLDFLAGSPPM